MKTFVTGSTGFLGSNLVRALEREGHEVVALARTQEKADKFLAGTRAEVVLGDMLNIDGFAEGMAGCDAVFHTAAYFKEYTGADEGAEALLEEINVKGTIDLMSAAKAQGVKHFIYTSSSGVVGVPKNGQPADESVGMNVETENRYFQSKIRSEHAVDQWIKANPEVRVIVIRPGAILGPGDNGPTGFGKMILDVLAGDLPAVPAGAVSCVDVRDVADGMVAALAGGESGDRFQIAGVKYSLLDVVKGSADAGGVKAPSFQLPYAMTWVYGLVSEIGAKITGNPPLATRILVKTLNEGRVLSSEKAKRELGVKFRPLSESLKDEVAWFKEFGYAG